MNWLTGRLAEPSTWGGAGLFSYFVRDLLNAWAVGDYQTIMVNLLPVVGGLLAMVLPERKAL